MLGYVCTLGLPFAPHGCAMPVADGHISPRECKDLLASEPGADAAHLDESRVGSTCLGERPLADAGGRRLVNQLCHPDRQSPSKLDVILGRSSAC
eukprot:4198929-Pyramimonas_sp.AAC.1